MRNPVPQAALFLLLACAPAFAAGDGSSGHITEDAVRAFYQKSVEVLKDPYETYFDFMTKSLSDDFVSVTEMTATIPGQPPTKNTDHQTKETLLQSARTAYDGSKEATVNSEVKDIVIAPNGKTATVTDETTIKGLGIPSGGGKMILGDSNSRCRDDLGLSSDGSIQITKSTCTVDLAISKGQSL
ncbi:MAG TPA: hypothetical protein VL625_00895 [Patescibacteria group bacterium]|nr:hypothetical protein [Patescibacteria group bacterium]